MKKAVLVVAAAAGAVAGFAALKSRGPSATDEVSETANVWALAVGEAAAKAADKVGGAAQSAAAKR